MEKRRKVKVYAKWVDSSSACAVAAPVGAKSKKASKAEGGENADKKHKKLERGPGFVVYLTLILYSLIIILPFLIIIIVSLKTPKDAMATEFQLISPDGIFTGGYKEVFTYRARMKAALPTLVNSFLNTLMYIIPPTLLGLFTSSIAGYAFAKLRFKAKNVMYTALISTMMIPGIIMFAPTFAIFDKIGWVDTPYPLMIPGMFGAAACVFFMRQFYMGIPDSLVEAAKIDGAGYLRIFFTIMVPLSVPALIAQGILGFVGGYNDYFNPLVYLQSSQRYNLQVALRTFAGVYAKQPNAVMAGTIVALVPTLIIYFLAQNYFIDGIVTSGIKQ